MDAPTKNGKQTKSYNFYAEHPGNSTDDSSRKDNRIDDEKVAAPPEISSSISAYSLRPSASRSSVDSPYLKSWQLLKEDDVENSIDRRSASMPEKGDSPYLKSWQLLQEKDDEIHRSNSRSVGGPFLTGTTIPSKSSVNTNAMSSEATKATSVSKLPAFSTSSSIYGTKNTKGSLEDDDPADSTANIMDHLQLSSPSILANSSSTSYGRKIVPTIEGIARPKGVKDNRKTSPLPLGDGERQWIKANESSGPMQIAQPKNDEDYNYDHIEYGNEKLIDDETSGHNDEMKSSLDGASNDLRQATHPVVPTCPDNFIPLAKEHTGALMSALTSSMTSSKSVTFEKKASYIRKLLERCKNDQEMLQGKLSEVLEEGTDATGHLMELVSISDEICAAIEAGEGALKREKERMRKNTIAEGPTIELLEENRDVFSLICMLRAPTEKRMQAALALMKFAKDDQVLTDEIISSGGIHSFLTLFQQTRGMTRELKVVASLAVAYILPSYVASSQTTSSIGLKLVECLHFLATSNQVSPNGIVITIEEMCKAASVGVNVLWINSIQPLIAMKRVKEESTSSPPSLRPGKTVRYGRLRSRTG